MKRLLTVLIVLAALNAPRAAFSLPPPPSSDSGATCCGNAVDEYDDSQSHPFRVIAYLVHPVGYALEWVVFRPLHCLVAQPSLVKVFGHTSHDEYAFDEEYL